MQKGFAHLVLVIALFGLISLIAVFFLQVHTPNYQAESKNPLPTMKPAQASQVGAIKEYLNNDLGISFNYLWEKYDVKVDSEDEYFKRNNGDARKNFSYYVRYEPGEFLGGVDLVSKNGQVDDAPFLVWVFNNPSGLDVAGWFKKYWYYPFNWGQFEIAKKQELAPVIEASINGQAANYGAVLYQPGSPKYYYVSKNGKMYLIRVLNDDNTLDSLKFL